MTATIKGKYIFIYIYDVYVYKLELHLVVKIFVYHLNEAMSVSLPVKLVGVSLWNHSLNCIVIHTVSFLRFSLKRGGLLLGLGIIFISVHILNDPFISFFLQRQNLILLNSLNDYGVKSSSTPKKDPSIVQLKVPVANVPLFTLFWNHCINYTRR